MDLKKYSDFVDSITSESGKNDKIFQKRFDTLSDQLDGNFARIDLGVTGLAGEVGEVVDIWKKLKYHNKDFTNDMRNHLIQELGDVYWYLAQISIALGVGMDEIIQQNMEKLSLRHGSNFSNEYMKK